MRAAGFSIVIYGLWEILGGMDNVAETLLSASQDNSSDLTSSLSYFVFGIPAVVLGALLFLLADWIVRLTYRNPQV